MYACMHICVSVCVYAWMYVIEADALATQVVRKVTHDTAVEKDQREKRARALVIVGKVSGQQR